MDGEPEQAGVSGIPASGRLLFTALRNGSVLGSHSVTFGRDADRLTVDIAVDYAVKLGFVTVFRYRLRGREVWAGGVLESATADTDDNGKPAFMRARRDGAGLLVEGSRAKPYRTPDGALIASHWNVAQLGAPMVNPQDGQLLTYTPVPRGPAKVTDSAGVSRPARRVALEGKNPLDLWYSTNEVWVALQARVADGSVVTYRPDARSG
jgi:hypothetical protein